MDYKIKVSSGSLQTNDLICLNHSNKLNERTLYYIIYIESIHFKETIYTIKSLFSHEIIKIRYGIEFICWHDGPQFEYSVLDRNDLKVNYMINIQINNSFLVMKSLIKNNKLNNNVLMIILEYYTDGNYYNILSKLLF